MYKTGDSRQHYIYINLGGANMEKQTKKELAAAEARKIIEHGRRTNFPMQKKSDKKKAK